MAELYLCFSWMESPCVEADLGTVVVVVGTGSESWTALCARLDLSCTEQKQGVPVVYYTTYLCLSLCRPLFLC